MTNEVLVVGDLLVDIVVVPEGPLQPGSDMASTSTTRGGGSAANTAAWLTTCERPVVLVAAAGDDTLGHGAVNELTALGVRFAGWFDPDRRTGSCVVLVDQRGERTMLPDRGANDGLPAAVVAGALTAPPAWLHLSGYTLLGDGSRPAAEAAIAFARQHGVRWSVDASSAAPLRALGSASFLEWVAGCDVLFANDDEVAALGGADAARSRVGALVVKHGPEGASWLSARDQVRLPSVATTVVDSVGAGDALDAGVIDALLRGAAPSDALREGCVVAALAVARIGARP